MRPTATDKKKQSEELARHTAEFLANGGVIDQVGIERRDGSLGSWKERSEAGKINNDNYSRVNARRAAK